MEMAARAAEINGAGAAATDTGGDDDGDLDDFLSIVLPESLELFIVGC